MEKRELQALAGRAVCGDAQAFSQLIGQYRQSMYATAIAVIRNEEDAMDAIQDTVLIMWEKRGTLRKPAYFKTWMTRILVNQCCLLLRRKKRETPIESLFESGAEEDWDISLDVSQALKQLSKGERLILQLYYFEDFSIKDIARALSLTPGTVRMRLTRSRRKFAQQYEMEVRHEKQ